jgi:hypothetical protein
MGLADRIVIAGPNDTAAITVVKTRTTLRKDDERRHAFRESRLHENTEHSWVRGTRRNAELACGSRERLSAQLLRRIGWIG